ncbi:hypothetical protein BX667DRAFT_506497 [Coemansia mojavensis]|nr:hypothetical protein BX667DRAFT_506497 [Coemansia mojavensis]
MSAFHNDIFNRRGSTAFMNEFRQDGQSGVFAPPAMPKRMFDEPASSGCGYQEGCTTCEDCVARGREIHRHEHCVECRGRQRGCRCQRCIHVQVSVQVGDRTRCATPTEGMRARTEETSTDSKFGQGRVRARSSTTMVGDSSFGFANMDAEMLRMAGDNRWRSRDYDAFYGRPFDAGGPCPPGHVPLREHNAGEVIAAHHNMHEQRQSMMRGQAAEHFGGYSRPMPLFGAYGRSCEDDEVKVKTTTTTTTTTRREVPCEPQVVHHPVHEHNEHRHEHEHKHKHDEHHHTAHHHIEHHHNEHHHSEHHHSEHHHTEHHHTAIPVGTRPDVPVKKEEACCTWCKFLPCFSCPHPTNPNARFHKLNFRLYPEYEFLPDSLEVPKPTEYFPPHTQAPTRASFKVAVPRAREVAQRIYVDFIGDQMVVIGEHAHPLRHVRSSPSVRSTRSSTLHEKHAPGHTTVFAKNFFVPRDTYDRDRAQAFVKPNGKLKIVVPVLGQ